MNKNQTAQASARAFKTAKTACIFCSGFTTAAAILAALYGDLNGFLATAGITAILIAGKAVLIDGQS